MSTSAHRFIGHTITQMSIEKLLTSLASREPHLENILREVNLQQVDDKNCACASISIDEDKVYLTLNRRKFNALFREERVTVLAHEFGHLALGHLSLRSFPETNRYIVGLAQDLALNSGLDESGYRLPDWFVTADKLNLSRGLSTSQYIPILENIGTSRLTKIVKIPDSNFNIDIVKNQKLVKSIMDKVKVNPHLAISSNNTDAYSRDIL